MSRRLTPMTKLIPLLRLFVAVFVIIIASRHTLRAQSSFASGVPIKIWAQAQAGLVSPVSYYYAGHAPFMGLYVRLGETTYWLCVGWRFVNGQWTTIGGLTSYTVWTLPNGQEVGPAYVGSDGTRRYPYYRTETNAPTTFRIAGTFMPASPTVSPVEVSNAAQASASYQVVNVPLGSAGIVNVLPGVSYTINVSRSGFIAGLVNISVPPQCRVVMNGLPRNSCDLTDTVTFTVVSNNEGPPGAAGFASTIGNSRADWRLALGTLRNGDDAGSLRMIDISNGTTWSALYTPAALNYEATSDEVYVHRVNNVITQIIANQVAINIVPERSTAYTISCYHPSQIMGAAPSTFTGHPFAVYRIEKGPSDTTLNFTKSTRDITDLAHTGTAPEFARVETMSLMRTGTWPNYRWTKQDWTEFSQKTPLATTIVQSGAAVLAEGTLSAPAVAESNGIVLNRMEVALVKPASGKAVVNVIRNFTWGGSGEVLASETLGNATGLLTTFNYYTDLNQPGSFGYVYSVALPEGGWEAYDYHDSASPTSFAGGRIKTRYRPYGTSPASATRSLTQGEVTSYTYSADPFGSLSRPASIVTKMNDKTTANTTINYDDTNGAANNGIVVSTRKDYSDATNSLQTVTKSYWEKTTDTFLRNKPVSIVAPGAVKQSFAYQRGSWTAGTFTAGEDPNTASRIAVIPGSATASAGTLYNSENGFALDPLYLVDGKSTKSVTFRDGRALVVRTESHVWKNAVWVLISFVDFGYNNTGLLVSRVASNGATATATYVGQLKMSDTDESGITTTYVYDAASRVVQSTRSGATGGTPAVTIPPVITRFTYDAAGNVLSQSVGTVAGAIENLLTTKTYDSAGRPLTEKPPGLGAITHSYDPAARTHTVTTPDGATTIDTKNRDGRPASRTGTAVVAQYFIHDADPDGRQWTRISSGTATSPRWQKTWQDWFGRQTRSERPAFTANPIQANYVETKAYDPATGRLTSSTATGLAPSLFVYDPLGRVIRTGLDVTGNGTLDLASADRISESDQTVEFLDNAWWARSETRQYALVASATPTVMSVTRQRLTNFSPAGRVAETRSTDFNGNVTTVTTDINRTTATAITTRTTTGSPIALLESKVAGLTVLVRGHDNLTSRTGYDSFLRPSTHTDSRNNTTTTAYHAGSTLVASITDATNTIVAQGQAKRVMCELLTKGRRQRLGPSQRDHV